MTTRADHHPDDENVSDYRHDETRKNNPPAALASQGKIRELRPQRYAYDPHMQPSLRFDDTGAADRLRGLIDKAKQEKLIPEEAEELERYLGNPQPWLEWTGKREKQWFEVEPVALHIHERVSAQAAIRVAARQDVPRTLWADPEQEYHKAIQFYQHDVQWANRLILGDSLAVMNSLRTREDMAGKVQMIYVDPPYGIRFASNFQPFVGNRGVRDTDADLTREPEVVKAYRDTWTLGIHTYLAYLRDRLTVARDLLTDSGSIFVQISDENVHRVRGVMDEVFGVDNFVSEIVFTKTRSLVSSEFVTTICDYILWYAKDRTAAKGKMRKVLQARTDSKLASHYEDSNRRILTAAEYKDLRRADESSKDYRPFKSDDLIRTPNPEISVEWQGKTIRGRFRTNKEGLLKLLQSNRIMFTKSGIRYKFFLDDYPASPINHLWNDVIGASNPIYVVQTNVEVVKRCMLMTTDPGDLVLDPTCGSGTTAYVAEQWGRRWITVDTSRVAVALARQRLLTSKFDYYETEDGSNVIDDGGFQYKTVPHITLRSIAQNVALDPIFAKWEPVLNEKLAALNVALSEVDGDTRASLLAKLRAKPRSGPNRAFDADERRLRLPKARWEHWEVPFDADPDYPAALRERLGDYRTAWRGKMEAVDACIAANADQEVLVDQPEVRRGVVRVSGPFTVESVHPPEESLGAESPIGGAPDRIDGPEGGQDDIDTIASSNADTFHHNMIRLLRHDGVRFQGNGAAKFTRLEPLEDGSTLHAEGEWEGAESGGETRVGVSFGPQYGPVTARQVEQCVRIAAMRGYDALLFAGFSFDGAAQAAIQADAHPELRVHMAHISPDVNMGDLLKQTKDSGLFSVSGLPRTSLTRQENGEYVVEMEGVDIFDPVDNTIVSEDAEGVAAWFLDGDYDGRTFCISQAFFPNSGAWDKLARALKSAVDVEAFAAFGGTKSLPFPAGEHRRAAVKVIDPRGNEVMKVHTLED